MTLTCKRIFLLAAYLSIVSAVALEAAGQQSASATLGGRIIDPNQAVVAGAEVTALQKATGTARTTTTNADGVFVLTNLPADEFEITIKSPGFAAKTVGVTLQVGQSQSLNVALSVAGVSAGKELIFGDDAISTETSVVDGVIGRKEIEGLPLNGRNFLELALLIPGNSPAPNFDPTKSNTVVISSAGQLGRGGNVTVDGAHDHDDVVGGQVQNISQEAVQEFQIATNRFSAQLGRSGSSVINIVTKSGTNEFHGSGSFYFRSKAWQGLPAKLDRGLGETPPFDREQYAFTLGGPVRKDRAWFFSSIEYRNQDGAALVGTRDLVTRTIRRSFAAAPLNDQIG